MKVYTICGSMRFEKEMKRIAWDLETKEGICVLQCTYDEGKKNENLEQLERVHACHIKKIDLADAIYVVNIGGYIGEGTKSEILYANSIGRDVIYHVKPKDNTTITKKAEKAIEKQQPKKTTKAKPKAAAKPATKAKK